MLIKTRHASGRTLYKSKPLLLTAQEAYSPPAPGKAWFNTTVSVWRVDELIKRSVRDWRRLLGETGHTGSRTGTMRADHDSTYTGTVSIFPAPLVEWILLRYGGPKGGKIIDAFAGGPPRGLVSTIMGYSYTGVELRQEQIDENEAVFSELRLEAPTYILGDGRFLLGVPDNEFDFSLTCPPYYNLETYSDLPDDLSNLPTYEAFNYGMFASAVANMRVLKPGAFMCIVVGLFRDKQGELVDFRGHTVTNFREAGFTFWQDVILSKNFGSAAQRSTNSWKGRKLVPIHEHLLIFRKPEDYEAEDDKS